MYCEYCIEKLIPDKKHLGQKVNWLVCPKCGARYRKTGLEWNNIHALEYFYKAKKIVNNNESNTYKENGIEEERKCNKY